MRFFTILVSISLLIFSCKAKTIVSFQGCHESACTVLDLYKDGTFDLNWSFPSSTSPDQNYHGKYLVLNDKIALYVDSSFNANGQEEKLKLICKKRWVSIEERDFNWIGNKFEPVLY